MLQILHMTLLSFWILKSSLLDQFAVPRLENIVCPTILPIAGGDKGEEIDTYLS